MPSDLTPYFLRLSILGFFSLQSIETTCVFLSMCFVIAMLVSLSKEVASKAYVGAGAHTWSMVSLLFPGQTLMDCVQHFGIARANPFCY